MSSLAPLTESEVKQLVDNWYAMLDVHAPVAELLPMLTDGSLEMRLPETTLHGQPEFLHWYEGVTHRFFDEVHSMKALSITTSFDQADIQLVVNWQAHIWNPPEPKSQWLGFDATQRWVVMRSPQTQKPFIVLYIVDALTPMPGSPKL